MRVACRTRASIHALVPGHGLTLLLRRWLLQLVVVTGVAVVTEVLVLEQCILTGGQTGERHEARYRRRGTRMINAN